MADNKFTRQMIDGLETYADMLETINKLRTQLAAAEQGERAMFQQLEFTEHRLAKSEAQLAAAEARVNAEQHILKCGHDAKFTVRWGFAATPSCTRCEIERLKQRIVEEESSTASAERKLAAAEAIAEAEDESRDYEMMDLNRKLAAAEARLLVAQIAAVEESAKKVTAEMQLATAHGLLREACWLVDEARLYELSTDWYERAKKDVGNGTT